MKTPTSKPLRELRRGMPAEYWDDQLLPSSQFWSRALAKLTRPTTLQLVSRLDLEFPSGINPEMKGVAFAKAGEDDKPCDSLLRAKRLHPNKVVIIRCGDFYETWGVDSAILSEYDSLQPMAGEVAKAGCPILNVQRAIDSVVGAGFSVVILEQREGIVGKGGVKLRFLADVLSSSNPVYVQGLLLEKSRDASFRDNPPVFAVAEQRSGLILVETHPDMGSTLVLEGLTHEAARARLARYQGQGQAIRLYVHGSAPASFVQMIRRDCDASGQGQSRGPGSSTLVVEHLAPGTPGQVTDLVEEALKLDFALPASFSFVRTTRPGHSGHAGGAVGHLGHQPATLYLGTASQLGLIPTRGVPDLAACMLPPDAPAAALALVRELLLCPPPAVISGAARELTRLLRGHQEALPDFRISSPARYAKTILKGEASIFILSDLLATCQAFLSLSGQGEAGRQMVSLADQVACYLTGSPQRGLQSRALVDLTAAAATRAGEVLYKDTAEKDIADEVAKGNVLGLTAGIIAERLLQTLHLDDGRRSSADGQEDGIPCDIFTKIDDLYTGRVRHDASEAVGLAYTRAEAAREAYRVALRQDLLPLTIGGRATLVFEANNEAVWLRSRLRQEDGLLQPRGKNGKPADGRLSTARVEAALSAYKDAAEAARLTVGRELALVSEDLALVISEIKILTAASNLLKTALLHIREARLRGWSFDISVGAAASHLALPSVSPSTGIKVDGFFPYWMTDRDGVKNSVTLDRLIIMTGANMSGKSSALRSIAAAAACSSAGLFAVNAENFSSPFPIDSLWLRTGAQDDPSSGKSAFSTEVFDVISMTREATPHSLTLIDELGRTTETTEGAALAGAVLSHLMKNGVPGIFATHFHELYRVMDLSAALHLHMESDDRATSTHRIMPGRMDRSLALEAARSLGLPAEILAEARDLAARLRPITLPDAAPHAANASVKTIRHHDVLSLNDADEALLGAENERLSTAWAKSDPPSVSLAPPDPPAPPALHAPPTMTLAAAADHLAITSGIPAREIKAIAPGHLPPPTDLGKSIVYVLRTQGGFFYVGESDDFEVRLTHHRKDKIKRLAEVIYAVVTAGKSESRRIETELIQRLRRASFPMLSANDGRHRSFGKKK